MQTIRTEVAQTIAPSGHRVLRVQFCGEGGESVTVDLVAFEQTNDAAAIKRAKAILVQTAIFDDYYAHSDDHD